MSSKEITHLIERMEMIEDQLGIRLSGLYASADDKLSYNGRYNVQINGELYSQSGSGITKSITIQYIGQNEKGQIIGLCEESISRSHFNGYHVFSKTLFCEVYPTRIKIIPRTG